MKFRTYYQQLDDRAISEKQAFKEKVMNKCAINEATFYRWINGVNRPGKLAQEAISNLTGIAISDLFPE